MAITLPALGSGDSYALTIANVLSDVCTALGWDSTDSDTQARAYRLITEAGRQAATYRDWWWTQASSTFTTTADTASYALRSEISSALSLVRSVRYWDSSTSSRGLQQIAFAQYEALIASNTTSSTPTLYAISGDQTLYLYPTPSESDKTVTVHYKKRHPKISGSADDVDLIVPAEWHYPIYVATTVWLARHDWTDGGTVRDCPAFMEAMLDMGGQDAEQHDPNSTANMHDDVTGISEDYDPTQGQTELV